MAAREVTPEADARWSLRCAREDKDKAKRELTKAQFRFNGADKRVRAALAKLHELGVEP